MTGHNTGRTYKCKLCGYRQERYRVVKHIQIAHPQKEYAAYYCELCGYNNNSLRKIQRHSYHYRPHKEAEKKMGNKSIDPESYIKSGNKNLALQHVELVESSSSIISQAAIEAGIDTDTQQYHMYQLDENSTKPNQYKSKPLPQSTEPAIIPWHGPGGNDPRVNTETQESTSTDPIVPPSPLRPDPLGLDGNQSDSLGPEDFNLTYFGLSPFTPQYSPGPFTETPSSSAVSSPLPITTTDIATQTDISSSHHCCASEQFLNYSSYILHIPSYCIESFLS